jgi:hypothetical protein
MSRLKDKKNSKPTTSTRVNVSQEEDFPMMENGKRDYLKVDPSLPGQSWVCLSFLSPEDMIVKKEMTYMNEFLVRDINNSLKAEATHMVKELTRVFTQQIEPIVDRYKASISESERQIGKHLEEAFKKCIPDESNFANRCLHLYAIDGKEIMDKYRMFKVQASDEIEKRFDKENNSRTSLRGIKVRGVFQDREEAKKHCETMRKHEPAVSVFVAPVGYWLPWDPDPDAVQDNEYNVPQLNELMKKYHDNIKDQKKDFDERKRQMIEEANMTTTEKKRKQLLKKLAERKKAQAEREIQERQRELAKEQKQGREKESATKNSKGNSRSLDVDSDDSEGSNKATEVKDDLSSYPQDVQDAVNQADQDDKDDKNSQTSE